MNEALLIIDVQNDYFAGGKMQLEKTEAALGEIEKVLDYFRKEEKTIVFIQHIVKSASAAFFVENTFGAEIHSALTSKNHGNEFIVQKNFPNSFLKTRLQEVLTSKQIDSLVICGMMTHMCVDSTTRQAAELGYHCTLLGDACATKDLALKDSTVQAGQVQASFLAALQSFATVNTTNDFLQEQ
ncbi:cysteine hydrolase [Sporolactobacillus shoreicorticis]|uniref:Cysteine hydrolase family protein n=1 Tax=Sporolactobacillus shoreicorticis TaxID=1923877 RepID=A0ABW5SA54_9BACL|nr:cysteine hydrolase family protein [Sporolactobacillus shoreicorticis]MCO7126547.1 cysteine hydrolase [Sporolactobacillus shoreicorticis]